MSAAWFAADWGTSNLRLWPMDADDRPIAELHSDQGMGSLSPDQFEGVLLALSAEYLDQSRPTPVVICGMAGARQGWAEAPYAAVPCAPPSAADAIKAPVKSNTVVPYILPGVCQSAPADVMRGEETQIAGFLANDPDFDGVLCLPGTHSKWVHISAGEIVSFRTVMTGEIFALLSNQSVLRHSVAGDGWDEQAFAAGVDQAMGRPAAVTADLFSLRAQSLLQGQGNDTGRARLSGLLVGLELAGTKPYWLGQRVAILGKSSLAKTYETALAQQGVVAELTDAAQLTLNGLTAAYQTLKDTTA